MIVLHTNTDIIDQNDKILKKNAQDYSKKIENIPAEIYNEILKDLPILCDTKGSYLDFNFNIDYFATPATGLEYDLDDGFKNYIF